VADNLYWPSKAFQKTSCEQRTCDLFATVRPAYIGTTDIGHDRELWFIKHRPIVRCGHRSTVMRHAERSLTVEAIWLYQTITYYAISRLNECPLSRLTAEASRLHHQSPLVVHSMRLIRYDLCIYLYIWMNEWMKIYFRPRRSIDNKKATLSQGNRAMLL